MTLTNQQIKDDFATLLAATPAWQPEQSDIVLPDDHPDTFAEYFEQWSEDFCRVKHKYNSIDGWSIYHNNRYQRVEDEKEIEAYLRQFLKVCKITTRIKQPDGSFEAYELRPDKKHKSPAFINSVVRWLRDTKDIHLRPSQKAPCSLDGRLDPDTTLAMRNGLLERNTRTLHPHTDQYYTLNYMTYDYAKDAISDKWGYFLAEITDGDKDIMLLLQQWSGYLLMNTGKYQKFLLCVGDGANGKGVFFDTLTAAIGRENVSNVPLACFDQSSKIYATYGKMANMSNENAKHMEAGAESVIKEYVGGDKMVWERKYKDAFSDYPTAKLMFATNILPIIRDISDGIWRRMIYVPFDVQIPANRQNKDLVKELQSPDQLAGILNWMLEGIESLEQMGGFIEPQRCIDKLNEYRKDSDSVRMFISEYLEISNQEDYLIKSEVYKFYQSWCKDNGYHAKGIANFGQGIFKVFPKSKPKGSVPKRREDGKQKTVYLGIKEQEGVCFGNSNSEYGSFGNSSMFPNNYSY